LRYKDVRCAQAYVGLADCYALGSFFSFVPPGDGYPKAGAAAKRAIEIDSKLAGAHASLAYAKAFYRRDWNGAESELKLAIELNSADVTAVTDMPLYLARVGRHDEARSEIKIAQQLDPLSLIATRSAGLLFYYRGRTTRL
jgi:Flp pilus assembly protein TadD